MGGKKSRSEKRAPRLPDPEGMERADQDPSRGTAGAKPDADDRRPVLADHLFHGGARFTDEERKINLQVPSVGGADIQSSTPCARVVSVFRDGRLALDGQSLTLDELVEQLRRDQRDAPRLAVSVRGDADGPFQNVASVLGACRTAGISEMAISVRLTR